MKYSLTQSQESQNKFKKYKNNVFDSNLVVLYVIFDYFGVESHTFSDDITEKQKSNRLILYEIMSQNGFKNYPKEWWHFTLEKEPFKKYFDFLVK